MGKKGLKKAEISCSEHKPPNNSHSNTRVHLISSETSHYLLIAPQIHLTLNMEHRPSTISGISHSEHKYPNTTHTNF